MATDPFALLGLEAGFSLDMAALQRAYLTAQQACHPDRFSWADGALRQQAALRSVAVNEAYQTLKSPLSRAQALLTAEGLRVGTDQDTQKPAPALLMEVMEWREALEDAGAEALSAQIATLETAQAAQIEALAQAFAARAFDAAAQGTLRLHYLEKTLSDAKAKRRIVVMRDA